VLITAMVLVGYSGSWASCGWSAGPLAMIGLSVVELGSRLLSEFISSFISFTPAQVWGFCGQANSSISTLQTSEMG
jgi:hypothetical protein